MLGDPMVWSLRLGAGPLAGRAEVVTTPVPLPELPDRKPYDFQFHDWDGDGAFDVLFAGAYLNPERTFWLYDLYWCRNTARAGKPRFDPPARLLTAPGQSGAWRYEGFAVRDRGRPGRADLVVSVSKDWTRKPEGGWANTSHLVLYRRPAGPGR